VLGEEHRFVLEVPFRVGEFLVVVAPLLMREGADQQQHQGRRRGDDKGGRAESALRNAQRWRLRWKEGLDRPLVGRAHGGSRKPRSCIVEALDQSR